MMTPKEFNWCLLGYIYRSRRQEELMAVTTCWMVNGRPKNGLRPERVVGRMIGPQFDEVPAHAYSWRDSSTGRDHKREPRG